MKSNPGTGPRVSIGLPVYNGARYLSETLESLSMQSFEDFEVIISDNASTDETRNICESYAASDLRFRYERLSENIGAAANYNLVFHRSRGELFKWAAHDDKCMPQFIEACVRALDENPCAALCYPSTNVIDANGAVIGEYRDGLNLMQAAPHQRLVSYLRRNFIRRQGLCNPIFGLIRRRVLERTRLIEPVVGADRLLLGHLAILGRFVELSEFLFERRVHDGTSTLADRNISGILSWYKAPGAEMRNHKTIRFNNYVFLRVERILNYYRAIEELVEDPKERSKCRWALTRLLVADPKWIYKDIKYSLGMRPSSANMMQELSNM